MATPKKLPSGNWNVTVYSHTENGKRKYVSFTAPTKTEANRLAAEFQDNKANEHNPQNLTVEKAVEHYISNKSNVLSPQTLKDYKNHAKQFGSIMNVRIGSLNSSIIQEWINGIAASRSPKTVRNYYSLLLSSVRLYSDRTFKVTLPQKRVIERNIPTDQDIKNLIENANPTLKLAIILGSHGLRRGEICALKYGDILRDFNAIYIHSDVVLGENGWVYKEIPKTSSSTRRVILPKEVIDMLGEGDEDEFILKVKPSTITTDFVNLRNRLGLKCRFHDTRHYSVSIMHAIGLPDAFIMEHNGYSSDSVMKSVYRHNLSDKSAHFSSIANDYFSKNIMGDPKEKTN